jgi:hypothetical protein
LPCRSFIAQTHERSLQIEIRLRTGLLEGKLSHLPQLFIVGSVGIACLGSQGEGENTNTLSHPRKLLGDAGGSSWGEETHREWQTAADSAVIGLGCSFYVSLAVVGRAWRKKLFEQMRAKVEKRKNPSESIKNYSNLTL